MGDEQKIILLSASSSLAVGDGACIEGPSVSASSGYPPGPTEGLSKGASSEHAIGQHMLRSVPLMSYSPPGAVPVRRTEHTPFPQHPCDARQGGRVVDRLEGADPPALTAKATALARSGAAASTSGAAAAAPAASPAPPQPESKEAVYGRIKYLLSTWPVVLFMKGSADTPRCGFSGRVVEALVKLNVSRGTAGGGGVGWTGRARAGCGKEGRGALGRAWA